jgi:hypothetical protein
MAEQYGGLASSAQSAGDDRLVVVGDAFSLSIKAIDDGAMRHLPLGGPYFVVRVNGVPVLAGHAGGIGRSAANTDFLLVVGPRCVSKSEPPVSLTVRRVVSRECIIVSAGIQVA